MSLQVSLQVTRTWIGRKHSSRFVVEIVHSILGVLVATDCHKHLVLSVEMLTSCQALLLGLEDLCHMLPQAGGKKLRP